MTAAVLLALMPVVLVIVLAAILRHREFLDATFWPQAERLGYYVLLPCLFFHSLATADLNSVPVSALALTLVIATCSVALVVLATRPALALDGPAFTSVFQGSIRFNNYVGVTLAAGLFGAHGVALAAICNAAIVPTVNILCVLVFARFGHAPLNAWGVVQQLVRNPLIMSSFAGILFQWVGFSVPEGVGAALKILGGASLPLGLLCVGAALEVGTARQWLGPVAVSSLFKLLLMPVATAACSLVIGLEGQALTTALLFQSLPTASSAYILARQLGGDAPLMAGVTAAQTVLAVASIPLVMSALSIWLPL
ncbi:AEC family transporter [Donghicola sp. XS_ASV15]|uniref:AEC family transporter n=1 Tax=Donghicola sp. XS_ASV15 TaxID=3241295 RepID=UPI003514ACB3